MIGEKQALVESKPIQPVTIIENIDPQLVQKTMQKITTFQTVVRNTLREGHDYGKVPGAGDRPVLLKPGAEKIFMLLGLSTTFETVEQVMDHENGFFAFTIRCHVHRGETKITEGLGHANTKERRYKNQDPHTLANTVLKMARKRAMVDAALTVAALSDIFTQDLEDIEVDSDYEVPVKKGNGRAQAAHTPDWSKFWGVVKGELKLGENEVRQLAAVYLQKKEVASLAQEFKNQEALDRFLKYVRDTMASGA